jgi:hypothetical protein
LAQSMPSIPSPFSPCLCAFVREFFDFSVMSTKFFCKKQDV